MDQPHILLRDEIGKLVSKYNETPDPTLRTLIDERLTILNTDHALLSPDKTRVLIFAVRHFRGRYSLSAVAETIGEPFATGLNWTFQMSNRGAGIL